MAGQADVPITVNVQNAPAGAKLDAWIDFTGDRTWSHAHERIADGLAVAEGEVFQDDRLVAKATVTFAVMG